jgi:6-phosphogluconolactonase
MQIYKPQVVHFETTEQMMIQAEDTIVNKLLDIVGEEGVARIALAGGKTPFPLYKKMAHNALLPWEQVEVFQVDERYIDSNNPHSNQFQIKEALGEDILARCREINFFNINYPADMAAKDYSEKLDSLDGQLFDITILGVGSDGHIASLFPNAPYLKHQAQRAIETTASKDFPVQQRLSLTLESVLSSELIIILLVGEDKSHIITEMVEGKKSAREFPAKFLMAHPNLLILQSVEQ